jgi:acyl dehydratase
VNAGDALPALERTITLTDMVAYAGATWDWHRLHYDQAYLNAAGLPRPVVDGQMLGALMAEQLLDQLGPGAFIARLGFRLSAMVFAGDTVRVEARFVEENADGLAVFAQRVSVGDRVAATGQAAVRR